MYGLSIFHIAWALAGFYLLVGLLVYERTGMRLGGFLLLPLLLVFALIDLRTLLAFGVATIATFAFGSYLVARRLTRGRGALFLFLPLGLLVMTLSNMLLGNPLPVFLLAFLPGLYAYNLHAETTRARGIPAFTVVSGALFVATVLVSSSEVAAVLPLASTQMLP